MEKRNLKLIAVADLNNLKLFVGQSLKILESIGNIAIASTINHERKKHDSVYQKKSAPASCFEPNSSVKDIDYQEAAHTISKKIEAAINNNKDFRDVIIVAPPKMLGHIRQSLSDIVRKKVTKEVNKDLINHSVDEIERAIFS